MSANTMKSWDQYPVGSIAFAAGGGFWEKTTEGWKWCTGATFTTPGADVIRVEEPEAVS